MKVGRSISIVVAILVVGLGMYGAYYYYTTQFGLSQHILKGQNNAPSPIASSTNPAAPVGPVAIAAVSPTSITVKVNDKGDTFTYAIGPTTHVYSLAAQGVQGKRFADLAVGGKVTIYPTQGDSGQVLAIAFPRDPSLVPTQDEARNSLAGVVSVATSEAVVIAPQSGALVSVTITPTTIIRTTVIEGQSGRPLSVGEHVLATGVSTVGGKTTATLLVIGPQVPTR